VIEIVNFSTFKCLWDSNLLKEVNLALDDSNLVNTRFPLYLKKTINAIWYNKWLNKHGRLWRYKYGVTIIYLRIRVARTRNIYITKHTSQEKLKELWKQFLTFLVKFLNTWSHRWLCEMWITRILSSHTTQIRWD